MWRGRKRFDLEAQLRTNRPEPRADFLRALSEDIHESRRGSGRSQIGALRLGLAAAVTALGLAGVASVAGTGAAASGVENVAKIVKKAVAPPKKTEQIPVVNGSPACDQYVKSNSGRGNWSEFPGSTRNRTDSSTLIDPHVPHGGLGPGDTPTDDCDPGNSGAHNRGGD